MAKRPSFFFIGLTTVAIDFFSAPAGAAPVGAAGLAAAGPAATVPAGAGACFVLAVALAQPATENAAARTRHVDVVCFFIGPELRGMRLGRDDHVPESGVQYWT